MITLTTPLKLWPIEGGHCNFLTLPEEQSGEIRAQAFETPRGFGSVRVKATIKDIVWRTSVFPQKGGGYFLPVKKAVCRSAGIGTGDEVKVTLELI